MSKIQVSLKKTIDQSYEISLNTAYLKRLIVDLKKNKWGNKYALICDSKVRKLYGNELAAKLEKAGVKVEVFSFQEGERNKNLKTVERLLDSMAKSNFYRDDAVIALGGGVTGDIAGFVASIYMRGIPYIQIPTTLLSMVDSSVGGKTGVDTSYGKNLVGTFTQPEKVYINIDFLKTLPKKQMLNGIAEAIKYGVIANKKVLRLLRSDKDKIMDLKPKTLEKLISLCIKVKARVVELDEKESEVRKILNYGHTFGHAIEKISQYKIEHGEAIAIGMCLINTIAVNKKWLKPKKAEKIRSTFKMYGLPTKYEKLKPANRLIAATKLDKKAVDGKILYIVPYKIGRVLLTDKITNRDIIKACKKHS
jgi:3-dehydroquinate synthase